MYVSLHSPASAAAYASCRGTLPLAKREGLFLCRAVRHGHLIVYEQSESNMPSLIALGKVASTKPLIEAAASRMSGVFSLRTAFILAHAQGRCASDTRKRYRLFGYKPHFRAAAGSPCRSRYRFARFGECGFYLKNTMHLLRIPENVSVSFPHKADAHVGDVTR